MTLHVIAHTSLKDGAFSTRIDGYELPAGVPRQVIDREFRRSVLWGSPEETAYRQEHDQARQEHQTLYREIITKREALLSRQYQDLMTQWRRTGGTRIAGINDPVIQVMYDNLARKHAIRGIDASSTGQPTVRERSVLSFVGGYEGWERLVKAAIARDLRLDTPGSQVRSELGYNRLEAIINAYPELELARPPNAIQLGGLDAIQISTDSWLHPNTRPAPLRGPQSPAMQQETQRRSQVIARLQGQIDELEEVLRLLPRGTTQGSDAFQKYMNYLSTHLGGSSPAGLMKQTDDALSYPDTIRRQISALKSELHNIQSAAGRSEHQTPAMQQEEERRTQVIAGLQRQIDALEDVLRLIPRGTTQGSVAFRNYMDYIAIYIGGGSPGAMQRQTADALANPDIIRRQIRELKAEQQRIRN